MFRSFLSALLTVSLVLTPLGGLAQPMGIPSMGVAGGAELSPALERTLGDAIMEQGRRDPTYISDPDITHYLSTMGRGLAAHAAGGAGQHIAVFALKDPQINAFALPGGYVGIHSGLVVAAESESELASVMAHEIAHVLQRHVARGMTRSAQSNHILLAAMAGALLAALAGSGDLAMGVAAFGQAAAIDRELGFSRQAEQEADRNGYEMLRKAGYDPRGMVRMFRRLANAARLNEGMGGNVYTSTHPLNIQRMSDIENRVDSAPAVTHLDSADFWFNRARLRVLQAPGKREQDQAVSMMQRDAAERSGLEQAAAWYGLAFQAWRQKDRATAAAHLKRAGAGGVATAQMAELDIYLALDQGDAAWGLRLSQEAVRRWPESRGVALARVHSFEAAGQDAEVVAFLGERIARWPDIARLHQLLAQAYERLDRPVHARRAMASYYESIGALVTAVEQLNQARGLSQDFYEQSELDVQIRTLKEQLQANRALLERFKS